MSRSTINDSKKSPPQRGRGRPATGQGALIGARWHDDDLAAIDAWREAHPEKPDRAEAIRRLVRAGLAAVSTEVVSLPAKARKGVRK